MNRFCTDVYFICTYFKQGSQQLILIYRMFFMLWFTEKIKRKNQFTEQNTDIILDQSSFFWPFTEKKTENFVNYRESYRIPHIFGQRPQAMKLPFYVKVKKYIFLFIEEPKNINLMVGKNYKFEVWHPSWGSIICYEPSINWTPQTLYFWKPQGSSKWGPKGPIYGQRPHALCRT